jgi:hypothetical protein
MVSNVRHFEVKSALLALLERIRPQFNTIQEIGGNRDYKQLHATKKMLMVSKKQGNQRRPNFW